jgi:hypothetical protein
MKLRLYLDTSVISAYVDDRMPERQLATVEFWNRLPDFDVSVSELTVTEVRATRDLAPQRRMDELIASFEVLPVGTRPVHWPENMSDVASSLPPHSTTRCMWRWNRGGICW